MAAALGGQSQFQEDVADVPGHGLFTQIQFGGDGPVPAARGDKPQHFGFPGRQRSCSRFGILPSSSATLPTRQPAQRPDPGTRRVPRRSPSLPNRRHRMRGMPCPQGCGSVQLRMERPVPARASTPVAGPAAPGRVRLRRAGRPRRPGRRQPAASASRSPAPRTASSSAARRAASVSPPASSISTSAGSRWRAGGRGRRRLAALRMRACAAGMSPRASFSSASPGWGS